MALKFLNKKGWHTGSLRNIENVWKAEQKNDAEQKKLEELKKQIHEERERAEFRQIQEQAGFIPRQERLEFLYDSGLAVGKSSSSSGFKELEAYPKPPEPQAPPTIASSSSSAQPQQSVPGALFGEEKPQSANDSWRKLHSDPLLLIRKREQEALARVKNNPVQMALIRKSVEAVKEKKESKHRHKKSKHRHEKSKHKKHYSDSESPTSDNDERKSKNRRDEDLQRKRNTYKDSKNKEESSYRRGRSPEDLRRNKTNYKDSKNQEKEDSYKNVKNERDLSNKRRNSVKISEEERAKRLKEMQIDAEINEEQRWKRIKKAEEKDKYEAIEALQVSGGRNFLDEAKRSVYGAEKGGSSTIEESVRRRKYYSQNKSGATESNAFRR